MSILSLLSILFAAQDWSTTCVMTQADGLQGYTIDQVIFTQDHHSPSDSKLIEVTFSRTWFEDAGCTKAKNTTTQNAELLIGSRISQAMNQNTFEADWTINGKTQLGAISVSDDGKSLRTATTSFGSLRNTMLSLFSYSAKK